MDSCDALIVGGGPAGSTCARRLRAAGMDVVVLDKKSFPRDKVCAGWVTPPVLETLGIDREDYARGRTFQPISGFRVGTLGGTMVETFYDQPVSYGIRRCEFDHYLLERAASGGAGARLRLGEALRTIERVDGQWQVNGAIRTPLVIGAGGHACPVARFLGAGNGSTETVVAAQEAEFELSDQQAGQCAVRAEVPELYFCPDLMGYAWCFRKGRYLNVGLGRENSRDLSDHVQAFLAHLKKTGRVAADTPDRFHGHAYILYGHTQRRLVGDGMLLIGDAAGLAYPQSGEGIRTAVESGLLAAAVITSTRGDFSAAALAPYNRDLEARLGKPHASDGWSALIPSAWKQALAGRLLSTPWFARHVVIDRWFLHRQQAALVSA